MVLRDRLSHLALGGLAAGLALWLALSLFGGSAVFSPGRVRPPLDTLVVAVDAGHGGYDGGCVGVSGTVEKEVNLALALALGDELQALGASVVYTRTEDVALIDPAKTTGYKKRRELDNRIALVQQAQADLMISIHQNAYRNAVQRGSQIFYRGEETEAAALAAAIHGRFSALSQGKTREPSAGDYYILRACPVSVLVECGFLSNRQDEALLVDPAYRMTLARALAQGVSDWYSGA